MRPIKRLKLSIPNTHPERPTCCIHCPSDARELRVVDAVTHEQLLVRTHPCRLNTMDWLLLKKILSMKTSSSSYVRLHDGTRLFSPLHVYVVVDPLPPHPSPLRKSALPCAIMFAVSSLFRYLLLSPCTYLSTPCNGRHIVRLISMPKSGLSTLRHACQKAVGHAYRSLSGSHSQFARLVFRIFDDLEYDDSNLDISALQSLSSLISGATRDRVILRGIWKALSFLVSLDLLSSSDLQPVNARHHLEAMLRFRGASSLSLDTDFLQIASHLFFLPVDDVEDLARQLRSYAFYVCFAPGDETHLSVAIARVQTRFRGTW